ncbi:MAG: hypothetical protein HZA89_06100 [Verrucomicrobia bacterium]|nr:hypothetical protein [Verrucomicrobiota bacterium]
MSEATSTQIPPADSWFSTGRFALALAAALGLAHFSVLTGQGSWFNFDYGVLGYPFAQFHRDCFWRGELPLWNPYSNCGAPFLAQWGTMALYPGALIYLLLPLPWSLGFFCLAHLFLGGLGMYFLARRWTNGHAFAAALAGFAFVFNGVTLSSLAWPNYTVALGWMPWLVLAAEHAWRDGGRAVILAALAGAMQMLSGVPELILLTWLFLLMWLAADTIKGPTPPPPALLRFGLLIALVAALTAAQLLPFFDLLAHSQRDRDFATAKWAMPGWGWANFFVPIFHYFRTPQGDFRQEDQTFLATYFLGGGVLLLAVLAALRIRERRTLVLAVAVGLGLILALGENGFIYSWLKQLFPALGVARYPIKFVTLLAFAVPLLAALAVRHLDGDDEKNQSADWTPAVSLWFCFVGVAGAILWFAQAYAYPYDQVATAKANAGARLFFLTTVLAALFGASRMANVRVKTALQFGTLMLVALDALTHLPRLNPTIPSANFAPNAVRQALQLTPLPALGVTRVFITPSAERQLLRSEITDAQSDFLIKRRALWSNLNLLDGVPKVNGSSTLQIREQAELQKRLYADTNNPPASLLDFLGVTHITAPGQVFVWTNRPSALPWITAGQQPIFTDPTKTLLQLATPDFGSAKMVYLPAKGVFRFQSQIPTNSTARVTPKVFSNHLVEFEVEAAVPAMVVIAQTFYHPWHATMNGQPATLLRANHAFQAVEVPAGKSTVRLIYRDWNFIFGALISLATLAGCGIAWKRMSRAHPTATVESA